MLIVSSLVELQLLGYKGSLDYRSSRVSEVKFVQTMNAFEMKRKRIAKEILWVGGTAVLIGLSYLSVQLLAFNREKNFETKVLKLETVGRKFEEADKIGELYRTIEGKFDTAVDGYSENDLSYLALEDGFWIHLWVPLERFRELIQDSMYRDHLYTFMVKSKKMNLGEREEYNMMVAQGLKSQEDVEQMKVAQLMANAENARNKIWSEDEQRSVFLIFIGTILLIVYPIRFLYYGVRWSTNELKTHADVQKSARAKKGKTKLDG